MFNYTDDKLEAIMKVAINILNNSYVYCADANKAIMQPVIKFNMVAIPIAQ